MDLLKAIAMGFVTAFGCIELRQLLLLQAPASNLRFEGNTRIIGK